MSTITVDTARLPLLLHEQRLPTVSRLWQDIAARADKATANGSARRRPAVRRQILAMGSRWRRW
jgi:hypothetical protein